MNLTYAQAWLLLGVAICAEVLGTTSMKASESFTKWEWTLTLVVSYIITFSSMTFALEKLDLGTSYAIWAGTGTAATAVVGALKFGEPFPKIKIVALFCVIVSVAFLKYVDQQIPDQPKPDGAVIAASHEPLLTDVETTSSPTT